MGRDFDFIVAGAGSAGCAIAARLSEEASVRVLLIEAGPDNRDWRIDMPLAVDQLLTSKTFNWDFASEPEAGLNGRVVGQPRGRVIGGSSSINGMVYTRGNPQDYDEWRDVHGCTGWGYADVLPYFRRMESSANGDRRYRGANGPLRITKPDTAAHPLNAAFIAAGKACGYPLSDDYNGAQHEGFSAGEQTIADGRRQSTGRAYLTPAVRARENLTILTGALVERLVIDGNRASGVVCRRQGHTQTFTARREIVLAAGAVGSPQIMKLSGIGPAGELKRHGIGVVLDQPNIGANLQDHPDLAIQYACREPVTLRRHAKWPGRAFTGLSWFLLKSGVAASNQFETAAYIRTRAGLKKPNLKLEFFPLAISPDTYKPYKIDAFQIHMTVQNARSRGAIVLRDADPASAPIINVNYLSDDADLATFREAITLTREIVAAKPFDRYRGREIEPGENVQSEAALDDWIRSRVYTAYHLTCTCRMGRDPTTSVVGPDLKVHGIEGLRVADASIMPHVVTANTNATVIMVGERAADLVLGKPALAPDNAPYWVHPAWETSQR